MIDDKMNHPSAIENAQTNKQTKKMNFKKREAFHPELLWVSTPETRLHKGVGQPRTFRGQSFKKERNKQTKQTQKKKKFKIGKIRNT
jgi:hypothetical protein